MSRSLRFLRPLPRSVTRPITVLVLLGWVATMAVLVHRAYLQASPATLATDLARYGPTAVWSGIYYRGEKIGFTVRQTTRTEDGFELQEDGRLQMLLLGQDTAATIRTTARVDTEFALRSFDFSLDPGTGPVVVRGAVEPIGSGDPGRSAPLALAGGSAPAEPPHTHRLTISITSSGVTRTETRDLREPPVLTQNLARLLASGRLVPGSEHRWTVLDPATLHNAPVIVRVGDRGIVRTGEASVPAFRVEMEFQGLRTTSWITDTGDVVREESPLGLMTVRESAERAQGLAVSARVQSDLLAGSAIVPVMPQRLDDPRDVRRLRLRLSGADFETGEMQGVGQAMTGDLLEITDPRLFAPGAAEPNLERYLAPEPLIESDAPEILAEAELALRSAAPATPANELEAVRTRAELLTRYVNALLDKKPTVGLPSARDVLRTKVGDCNEHTALYVAMARAIGIPARIAVGLVYMHGAFYYHAWPEVYLRESDSRGMWLPVDPTLNQFPADATHIRFARGGLDKQAAILPLLGQLQLTVVDMELVPESERVVLGPATPADLASSLPFVAPRAASRCECHEGGP